MSANTRIRVTGSVFDCEDCANTIDRILMQEEGVEDVAADDRERKLEVRFDPSRVDEERLERVVDEWGYTP